MHTLRVYPGPYSGQHIVAHGFTLGLSTHAVEVVKKVEHHRRGSTNLFIPQRAVLFHCRQAHSLPHRAAYHGSVSDICDHNTRLPIDALKKCRSDTDVGTSADYRIIRHRAKGGKEGVHRAAEAPVEARPFGKN